MRVFSVAVVVYIHLNTTMQMRRLVVGTFLFFVVVEARKLFHQLVVSFYGISSLYIYCSSNWFHHQLHLERKLYEGKLVTTVFCRYILYVPVAPHLFCQLCLTRCIPSLYSSRMFCQLRLVCGRADASGQLMPRRYFVAIYIYTRAQKLFRQSCALSS